MTCVRYPNRSLARTLSGTGENWDHKVTGGLWDVVVEPDRVSEDVITGVTLERAVACACGYVAASWRPNGPTFCVCRRHGGQENRRSAE